MTTVASPSSLSAAAHSRLRIVHYVPGIRLEQGGVVRAVLDWCTVFAARGHHVTLIAYQGNDIPRQWLNGEPGKPVARVVPPPRALPGKPLGDAALKIAEETIRDSDVLHLHGPWLDGNRQLAAIARRLNVPYVLTLHGMLDDWSMTQRGLKKRLYMRLWGRKFLAAAAYVHCTAEVERSQSARWFENPRAIVLPYIVELSAFEHLPGPELGLQCFPPDRRAGSKLLFLSRLHEQKGIDILIRAVARLRDAGLDFTLVIAGTGETSYVREMHALVAQLNLRDRVIFVGLITGQQKLSLFQAADLFVLPTRHENFGLVLTEAMACGTPVLTSTGTDIWRELETAGGTIAPRNTPPDVADAMRDLLTKPREVLAEMGKRGRAWVFETLAVEPLLARYEALYRDAKAQISSAAGSKHRGRS